MPAKGTRKMTLGKLTWIDVQNPEPKQLHKLKDEHKFHELDIEDCLSEHQRAKVDEYDDYLFIILHIPYYDKRQQRIVSEEVDIFVKNNVLVTVHWGGVKALSGFYDSMKKSQTMKKAMMGHGSGFLLYELLDHLYSSALPILDFIERNLTSLERDVFNLSRQQDLLKDILNLKKNIITFRRVITPQRHVIAQIEHKNQKFLPASLEIYFDDVVDKVEKIWNSLENHKELIESLQDTNESIISHTTNNVIKILTVFSVLLLPLTFLTGLYGINVALPGDDFQHVFYVLVIIMATVVTGMLAYFKYKRWI